MGMASGLILLLRNLQSEVLICFLLTCNFGTSVSCFCLIGEDKKDEEGLKKMTMLGEWRLCIMYEPNLCF